VHLPARGDPAAARAVLGPNALVGMSIHSAAEAAALDRALVDYAVAGPAFAIASKPGYGPALGIDGLAAIARATTVPVVAIGGIAAHVVPEVMETGVVGAAVMGTVMRAAAPAAVIKQILAAFAVARAPLRTR
jgi:thiamine-phosphate pyrophosphorylase